jgi:hypothetical protein
MVDTYLAPFDDDMLVYDIAHHWYLLNPNYVFNTLGEAIDETSSEWKQLQYDLTNNLYSYIYSFKTGRKDHDQMEYELAKNQTYREVLCYCLLEQYKYAKTSGGDLVQLQHAVNINTDNALPIDILRGDYVVANFAMMRLYQYDMLNNAFKTDFDYTNYRVDY